MEAVRIYGPQKCVSKAQGFFGFLDGILLLDPDTAPLRPTLVKSLKGLFGLEEVEAELNVADVLARPRGLSMWQSRNWDPEIGSSEFDRWCETVESDELLYPETENKRKQVEALLEVVSSTGKMDPALVNTTLNWIGYINETSVAPCLARGGDFNGCFSINETFWQRDDVGAAEWRSWTWQWVTVFCEI
jgi:hypothetical protein